MTINLALTGLLSLFCLYSISFLLGNIISNKNLIIGASSNIQKIIIGYSIIAIIIQICIRSDYPLYVAYTVLFILLLIGTFRCFKYFHSLNYNFLIIILSLISTLLIIWIVAYPLLFSGAIFYGNIDPGDLNGFASGYLIDRPTWSNMMLMRNEMSLSGIWSRSSGIEYSYPDYRAAVSYDNFIILRRWLLPIISSEISRILQLPTWFGVFFGGLSFFLLIPVVIFDFCRRNSLSLPESLMLAYSVCGISLPLLWYEGLFAHIAAMPILLLFIFNITSIFSGTHSIGKYFVISLLTISLLITWAEGISLLIILFFGYVLAQFIFSRRGNSLLKYKLILNKFVASGYILILCILISPQIVIDFILLNINRLVHGFSPGILGFNWSLLDIFLPFPFVRIVGGNLPNIQLFFERDVSGRIIESLVLFLFTLCLFKNKLFLNLLIAVFTIFVFSATGQPYVFWNIATILQPIILISIYLFLRESISKKINITILIIFMSLTIYSMLIIQKDYSKFSRSIYQEHFQVKKVSEFNPSSRVAYLTPSLAEGYLRLGWDQPLYWVNKIDSWLDLKVQYKTESDKNLNIVAYYNCSLEGLDRCMAINKYSNGSLKEYQQYSTGLKLNDILGLDGTVDKKRMSEEVRRIFGVEYQKLNQTLP
jgi:hypothetical protein